VILVRLVGICTAAVLWLGSGGAASRGLPLRPAATSVRIVWTPCGRRLQCARVRVPLDWAHPSAGTISLALIRYLAGGPGHRIGSIFFNPGGPGASGVDAVRGDGAALAALGRGRFDVVSWDPRGTGASTHVRCFSSAAAQSRFWGVNWSIPTTRAQSLRYVVKATAFARRCAALSGSLLAHISTEDTAHDLDYLRRLVGDRQLTYLGWSYGTFLGQTYANMFPRRVRAMVLDGAVDPVAFTTSVAASIAGNIGDTDRVFAKLQSLCRHAGRARCALAGHGLVSARVNGLLARLRHGPIPAPSAEPSRLTYGDLLLVLYAAMGNPAAWPALAANLERAARGDGSALESEAGHARPGFQSALVSATALQCADKPAPRVGPSAWPQVIGRLTRISRTSGPVNGWWLWAPCAAWPVHSAERYTGPWNADTTTPILVVGTRFDPNTKFANAQRVARRLGNAVLLTHDGYGHVSVSDPSACVIRATGTYLVERIAPPRGTVCTSDRQPFDPQFGQP
jgi:pimeloyl-ACP methyl ester carboxylesterase